MKDERGAYIKQCACGKAIHSIMRMCLECAAKTMPPIEDETDPEPPSYLPAVPDRHAVERVPDLNPDDRFCASCGCQGGVHHGWCKS